MCTGVHPIERCSAFTAAGLRPLRCARCGSLFLSRAYQARVSSEQCRWRAQKVRQRASAPRSKGGKRARGSRPRPPISRVIIRPMLGRVDHRDAGPDRGPAAAGKRIREGRVLDLVAVHLGRREPRVALDVGLTATFTPARDALRGHRPGLAIARPLVPGRNVSP